MSRRLRQSVFLQLFCLNFFSINSTSSAISLKKSDIAEEVESVTSPINRPMSQQFSDSIFEFPIENEWEAAPINFSPTNFFSNFFRCHNFLTTCSVICISSVKSELQNFYEKKLVSKNIFFTKYYSFRTVNWSRLKKCVGMFLGSQTRVNFYFLSYHSKRVILLRKSNLSRVLLTDLWASNFLTRFSNSPSKMSGRLHQSIFLQLIFFQIFFDVITFSRHVPLYVSHPW